MANFFGGFQQPQPQYQQQNNAILVVPVQGEQGANLYPVAAGNTVFLFDFNQKKFWIKSTDINGLPAKFAAFTFIEEVKPVQNDKNFVSRNEFEQWKNEIVDSIKALIGGKGNVSANVSKPAVQTEI